MKAAQQEKRSLGRGLSSLLPETNNIEDLGQESFSFIEISKVTSNPYQPRQNITLASVMELSESIKEKGVMQPLVVVRSQVNENDFILVAGERRLQAAKLAGLKEVPAIIKNLSDKDMAELAIIENIHRKDLNPIEEGFAFLRLNVEFNLSYEEISQKISKTKAYVENKVRLTRLPKIIQNAISVGEISENHGRILFGLNDEQAMIAALKIVIRNKLSVEKTDELVRQIKAETLEDKKSLRHNPTLEWQQKFSYITDELVDRLGSPIKLKRNRKDGGSLVIKFNSDEELISIYRKISDKQQ